MLEEKGRIPVAGVLPYMSVKLEDEDSLSERFDNKKRKVIDIAIVRFPRISNFTDFNVFEQNENVSLRYVTSCEELEKADMIILPGSKNTIGDLKWMRQNGIEAMVKKMSEKVPVFGICGGFQMLGESISDPESVEEGGNISGMGLLDTKTVLRSEKTRTRITGKINTLDGFFSNLSDLEFEGYEIHVGESVSNGSTLSDTVISDKSGRVYGTYVHGIFDKKGIAKAVIDALAREKNVIIDDDGLMDYASFKEKEYERMADILREHLDMEKIYGMLKEANIN